MNPFDFTGPEFLAFYVALLAIAASAGALLRWFLRLPADVDALRLQPTLSAYEISYLATDEKGCARASIARLAHAGALNVDAAKHTLSRGTFNLPADATLTDRYLYAMIPESGDRKVSDLIASANPATRSLPPRVEALGLTASSQSSFLARAVPTILFVFVFAAGVAKIGIGISRERPVAFLVVLVIVAAIGTVLFAKAIHRTRRGDAFLRRLKDENAALRTQARRRPESLTGDDLVIALSLFGMDIVMDGPVADVRTALKPKSEATNCGAGCGSYVSSCGGGGGGCGGGGGGGGGCGGCGS